MQKSDDNTGVLPYKLRPGKEKKYASSENSSKKAQCDSISENVNIIVNVKKL